MNSVFFDPDIPVGECKCTATCRCKCRHLPALPRAAPHVEPLGPHLCKPAANELLNTGVSRSYENAHPLAPPKGPRHGAAAGSCGGAFSYERGTPVQGCLAIKAPRLKTFGVRAFTKYGLRKAVGALQGYLAHKKPPPPLGPP